MSAAVDMGYFVISDTSRTTKESGGSNPRTATIRYVMIFIFRYNARKLRNNRSWNFVTHLRHAEMRYVGTRQSRFALKSKTKLLLIFELFQFEWRFDSAFATNSKRRQNED